MGFFQMIGSHCCIVVILAFAHVSLQPRQASSPIGLKFERSQIALDLQPVHQTSSQNDDGTNKKPAEKNPAEKNPVEKNPVEKDPAPRFSVERHDNVQKKSERGIFLFVNDNDSNGNGIVDCYDSSFRGMPDPDWLAMTIHAVGPNEPSGHYLLTYSGNRVHRLMDDGSFEIVPSGTRFEPIRLSGTLFIEAAEGIGDAIISVEFIPHED